MGASGQSTVDLGAFPGKDMGFLLVTGQTGFVASSELEAWVMPVATADHSVEEHMVETIKATATYFADGQFLLWIINTNQVTNRDGPSPMIWGRWNVGWVWN